MTDFHCVEGWSVYDVQWNGVHLQRLFDLVQPTAAATYVTFHTLGDIYNESLKLDVALEPRTILGYGVGGNTLPVEHGFPLRVVIPRLLGYKNAKYIERIELTDAPAQVPDEASSNFHQPTRAGDASVVKLQSVPVTVPR